MSKILVTGGAGFIGSHVADGYLKEGHDVTILDNQVGRRRANLNTDVKAVELDITSPELANLFERERFDIVNHHAAQASVPLSVKDPELDARINILGGLNLLQASVRCNVKKFIFASSGGTVYGNTDQLPAVEELPFAANSPYGVSKVATELYLKVYAEQYRLAFTVLRYSNVYGPRQDPHGEAGVVAIFTEKMLAGGTPVINGDGEFFRDYVYVGDVVRANLLALTRCENEAVNIGTGIRTSTTQLFASLKALTGYSGPSKHGPPRPGDLRDSCLAVDKAKRTLGWEPRVPLEEGLQQTVKWFRSR